MKVFFQVVFQKIVDLLSVFNKSADVEPTLRVFNIKVTPKYFGKSVSFTAAQVKALSNYDVVRAHCDELNTSADFLVSKIQLNLNKIPNQNYFVAKV